MYKHQAFSALCTASNENPERGQGRLDTNTNHPPPPPQSTSHYNCATFICVLVVVIILSYIHPAQHIILYSRGKTTFVHVCVMAPTGSAFSTLNHHNSFGKTSSPLPPSLLLALARYLNHNSPSLHTHP